MASPRVVGILVARMGSSRVPGKSLADLCGKPVLWHVIEIAKRIQGISELCLATTDQKSDEPLLGVARECGIRSYRGDAEKVLDRVHGAATEMNAEVLIEIGGDCPLLDPQVVEDALQTFHQKGYDYLCNYEPPTYPEGMDINILKMAALTQAYKKALAPSQRVHPFSYLTRHPTQFNLGNIEMSPNLSTHHWSLDFPEDMDFIRAVYEKLYKPDSVIRLAQIVELIQADGRIGAMDQKLRRPQALHAFWNSPGIVRDMHSDVAALSLMAQEAALMGDHARAGLCYDEMKSIVGELDRQAKFSGESS